jgi:Zn-dependent peptidase ImmA (M78 family)
MREIALDLHERSISFVPDDYIIDINKHDDRRVNNFTICHEIDHIVLQGGRLLEKQNTRTSDYFTEKMCDMIAAGLLMPKAIFIREATEMWPSFSSIQAIADRFDVTPKAAQRRILDLRIWNCAAGYWVPKLADFPAAGFICR